ncbi:helix-turn-helix domain-containing protein [Pseudobacteriovorax antillogorgiicola]|uniref:DNA-binding transcriptional regulator, XRE family n=1 Tax=Pseudobacteriovorax antillogorgiicola TaxID=1513793 RepID=A0A1Y6CJF2_9BACT|nr:helix-turn-helix transcriptional regulator [Pseudobacteriovorax antillogorgiicola]TCS48245.1 DNA-binding Xre family transcriptional regulator [Pseudobacteriovorax antillogorgiicola]SMF57268.1 DNA-binding transcriptional regulator, XRE family [Pseudobacteriovorax antillogorgiicola]
MSISIDLEDSMNPCAKSIRINSNSLLAIVVKKNIKLTWLAHVTLVDRKTISRWLSGDIKRVRRENFFKLVDALECEPEELVHETMTNYASKDEQINAAREVLNLVKDIKDSKSVEKILKGMILPTLPNEILVALYKALSQIYELEGRDREARRYKRYASSLDIINDDKTKAFSIAN